MTKPDLSIVIVSWNVRDSLLRCLAALPAAIEPCDWEAIIIDNASSDGSAEEVQRCFPEMRVIANAHNRLYTAAANQGLAAASGRHLLLLNPDTLPRPSSLAHLVRYADHHVEAGLLGPRILDLQNHDDLRTARHYPTAWSEMLIWSGLTMRFPHHPLLAANLRPTYDRSQTGPVPLLSGACLLLSEHLTPDLRRLQPTFPMYGEDVDLSRRIQDAGYQTILVAKAIVIHAGAESSRQAPMRTALLAVDGANRYLRVWQGRGAARRHRLGMAMVAVGKWLGFSLLGLMGREAHPARQRQLHSALLRWAWCGRLEVYPDPLSGAPPRFSMSAPTKKL